MPTVKNVVLISIDTLRPDALSLYGGRTRTPFFEDFARGAVVFDHALTCAPLTLPAHTSLLTGLYPPAHGVRNNGAFHVPSAVTELSEIAKENGLNTAAVVGGFPLASQFGLNQGFDFYDDHFLNLETSPGVFLYAEKNAEAVRASAETWLTKNAGRPFFLWLHFFDPHHPYLQHGMSGIPAYQQEVLYVDQQLEEFFRYLKKNHWDESSMIVITADHGEAFGENGEISHSLFVYNTTLKIPLLISVPGVKSARVKDLVRIIDVVPTIMDVLGWKSPAVMNGLSLLPLLQGNSMASLEAYAETLAPALDFGWSPLFSIQDLHAKYIQAPHPEFYTLESDPGENNNVIATTDSAPYVAKIRRILELEGVRSQTHTLSSEEREKLASLGYFSSGQWDVEPDAPDPKDKVDVARKIAELTAGSMSLQEKRKAYAEIVATEPDNPLLMLRYAEVLLKLQKLREAEDVFKKVAAMEYSTVEVYNGLAATYFYQGKINEAQGALQQALSRNLADGETYYNLGEIAFNHGEREKAFQYYDHSMKLGYVLSFFRKARLVEITGETEEALKLLQQAEALNPDDGQANYEKGIVYFRHDQLQQALEEFKNALKKNPSEIALLYNIGLTYSKLGDEAKAKETMRQFLTVAPAQMKEERAIAQKVLQ